MMNEKPLTPAEFAAIAKAYWSEVPMYVVDQAYSMLSDYSLPPSLPGEAVRLVQMALMNIGAPVDTPA